MLDDSMLHQMDSIPSRHLGCDSYVGFVSMRSLDLHLGRSTSLTADAIGTTAVCGSRDVDDLTLVHHLGEKDLHTVVHREGTRLLPVG